MVTIMGIQFVLVSIHYIPGCKKKDFQSVYEQAWKSIASFPGPKRRRKGLVSAVRAYAYLEMAETRLGRVLNGYTGTIIHLY